MAAAGHTGGPLKMVRSILTHCPYLQHPLRVHTLMHQRTSCMVCAVMSVGQDQGLQLEQQVALCRTT